MGSAVVCREQIVFDSSVASCSAQIKLIQWNVHCFPQASLFTRNSFCDFLSNLPSSALCCSLTCAFLNTSDVSGLFFITVFIS